jgi:two-component system alkaline phosphatase synthesis response regulator PhoP
MGKDEAKASTILLVEDEESLAIGLEYNLQQEGYRVVRAEDGRKAIECFQSQHIDLIILDIMLPHLDGFEVAKRVRETSPQLPILILTARTTLTDKIQGLEIGVDDYLTKPFHLKELLLRIRGMLKRKAWYKRIAGMKFTYSFSDCKIDFSNLSLTKGKQRIMLTPLEAMLLRYLADNPERVVSRKELLENVWQSASEIETRTVDNFIVRLRKYIEHDPSHPLHIKNVRGAGYMFFPTGGKSSRSGSSI